MGGMAGCTGALAASQGGAAPASPDSQGGLADESAGGTADSSQLSQEHTPKCNITGINVVAKAVFHPGIVRCVLAS